jgi:predicted HicB family RNase H-like nuclease
MAHILNVDPELHKKVKLAATRAGIPMQELVRLALEKELAARREGAGSLHGQRGK